MPAVYRVEREDGAGPYRSYDALPVLVRHLDDANKPTPDRDFSDPDMPFWRSVFGFASIAQFCSWFSTPEERAELSAAGYRIDVYDAPSSRTQYGAHQVIFDPTVAERLGTLPIPDTKEDA